MSLPHWTSTLYNFKNREWVEEICWTCQSFDPQIWILKKKGWTPMNSFVGTFFPQIASVQGSRPNTGWAWNHWPFTERDEVQRVIFSTNCTNL
jgi:hypothetical protein